MLINCPTCSFVIRPGKGQSQPVSQQITCPRCGALFMPEAGDHYPVSPAHGQTTAPAPFSVHPAGSPAKLAEQAGETEKIKTPVRHLEYKGQGATLLAVYIKNLLFSILTLGIYNAWGKTRVRKYLYSHTEFLGERFLYTGTGKELFRGKIKATALLFIIFYGIPKVLSIYVSEYLEYLPVAALPFIIPLAVLSTRRYRLSRTLWRGLQFSFKGQPKEAVLLYLKGIFVTVCTFGVYAPYFYASRQSFWRRNTWYGSASFHYDANEKEIFWPYLKGAILIPLTFGLYWPWFKAKLMRFDWDSTSFGGLTFSSTITGGALLKLQVTNMLMIIFTLGVAYPWTVNRKMDLLLGTLHISGDTDLGKIRKSSEGAEAVGEGLLGQFEMDMGF